METHSSTKLRNDDCGCKDIIFSDSWGHKKSDFSYFCYGIDTFFNNTGSQP